MDHALLKLMHDTEDSWWYRGRIAIVHAALQRARIEKKDTALDLGAGYGGMLSFLKSYANSVDAFEPDSEAAHELLRRGYRHVFADADQALGEPHDIIGLFDVLEHIDDDANMLVHLRNSLSYGGVLVLTVPAYQWLWSVHDDRNMHFRRYRADGLRQKLQEVGFEVRYIGYWNTALFPVAALLRAFGIAGESGLSPGKVVNMVLLQIIRLEALLVGMLSLPFGLSVVAVAVKKK